MQALTPHVNWAQRHGEIYLRVEISDAQNLSIGVEENILHFRGQGHGAKGENEYEFSLEFLKPVKPEVKHKSTQRQVNITIKKQEHIWWDRLTKQERKLWFLAPDFDRWLDESDAEMELREKEEKLNKVSIESRVRKDPFLGLKKGFLFMYNLVQFLGFSWIFVNMTVRLFILGQDSFYDTFHTIADVMYFCQMLAIMEVINPAVGLVKTGVIPAFIQVMGRNFILFVIFGNLEDMQNKPVVFFVFYLWSAIEIFRYPFYMLACIDTEWKLLTWVRYTIWIPLYPLGVLAEAVAVIQSIPIFDETKLLGIPLPKAIGTSLSFSYILQIYLALMFLEEETVSHKEEESQLSFRPREDSCFNFITSLPVSLFSDLTFLPFHLPMI
ncbi:very-long-chain (3R)-3-hydroxyacyl-CoA dehydratase isoform X2 [Myxocyprinus asiaticus]|uniref:very-long-chain (3R)-3-hydroxyacyl-CoA dehydratase isoform X2 n=1 Tax=Myxocyprinus asiaticus TaxID=70543 RepID=UPI002223A4B8|nr:very-long-chain (3R)-3-hydroxyacyl-CoA dehydratase isoform X2 [Myxocyprinus asiaticus]